jgi:hypothetical protein
MIMGLKVVSKNNMKSNRGIAPVLIAVLVAVVILVGVGVVYITERTNAPTNNNAPVVGGDRDAHGCIGSAGYSWCQVKSKCLRTWEEPCTF